MAVSYFNSSVMTSLDGIIWTLGNIVHQGFWSSVTYGNGLFVAVATSGDNQVKTSPDGIMWTARTAAEQNNWTSVAYGNGQFVAVAYDGVKRVMTSTDGISWTASTATEQNFWTSVTYGNSQFVAVAKDGTHQVMNALANQVATLTLTGNANNHADANDVSDITFDFDDSAFMNGNAANVINGTGPASSALGVDFDGSGDGLCFPVTTPSNKVAVICL
ncbi:MAG: hypothetical protein ACI810_002177 [Gammaproteobacteria bacterium]